MARQPEEIIEAVAPAVQREALRRFPRNFPGDGRCLMTARAGVEVLRYFGVAAKPMVVAGMYGNRAWVEWVASGPAGPMPDEAWSVGITAVDTEHPDNPRSFHAHLVLLVEGRWLLDIDAAQFARPAKGILVPDWVAVEWDERGVEYLLPEGGRAMYLRHQRPQDFRRAPDWKRGAALAGTVIREVRETLDTPSRVC